MTDAGSWKIAPMQSCELPEIVATGFSKVMKSVVGATYMPVLYAASQVVHGANYMIICTQKLTVNPPAEHLVKVILHYDENDWVLMSIEQII